MKKHHFKSKIGKRLQVLSALLFGLLFFQAVAPFSLLYAMIAFTGFATMPFWSKKVLGFESGILGSGTPAAAEEQALLDKVKKTANDAAIKAWEEFEKKAPFMDSDEFKKKFDILVKDHPELGKLSDVLKDLKELGDKVAALGEKSTDNNPRTFKAMVLEGLAANKDALVAMKTNRSASVNIEVKAAGTMTRANDTPIGSGISILQTQTEPGLTPIPRAAAFFMNLFSWRKTSKPTIAYAELKNPDGGAGMTAEGALKSQADFDIVEAKADVKKITAFIKVSKEALDDIDQLEAEINNELTTLLKLKADSQCLLGDGTGNNLNGILTISQAFTGSELAGTITAPNNYDVLEAAMLQIELAEVVAGEPAGFMPNVIVMNPADIKAMKLTKDLNNNYVFPIMLAGVTMMEIPVVSNPRMTAGEFLVMDSTKVNPYMREGITLNAGYENDDFTKNLVTILGEMRLTIFVKSNHLKAFVTGDFATAKDLLGTV